MSAPIFLIRGWSPVTNSRSNTRNLPLSIMALIVILHSCVYLAS